MYIYIAIINEPLLQTCIATYQLTSYKTRNKYYTQNCHRILMVMIVIMMIMIVVTAVVVVML